MFGQHNLPFMFRPCQPFHCHGLKRKWRAGWYGEKFSYAHIVYHVLNNANDDKSKIVRHTLTHTRRCNYKCYRNNRRSCALKIYHKPAPNVHDFEDASVHTVVMCQLEKRPMTVRKLRCDTPLAMFSKWPDIHGIHRIDVNHVAVCLICAVGSARAHRLTCMHVTVHKEFRSFFSPLSENHFRVATMACSASIKCKMCTHRVTWCANASILASHGGRGRAMRETTLCENYLGWVHCACVDTGYIPADVFLFEKWYLSAS